MNRSERSAPSNAPLDVFLTPTKSARKVSAPLLAPATTGARIGSSSRKDHRPRTRSGNFRRHRASSLRRMSLPDIVAAEESNGLDKSNSNSNSNSSSESKTRKVQAHKSNYDKIREEIKSRVPITDIAVKLQTQKKPPLRSNSDGGASVRKRPEDSKPALRRTSTWANDNSNGTPKPTTTRPKSSSERTSTQRRTVTHSPEPKPNSLVHCGGHCRCGVAFSKEILTNVPPFHWMCSCGALMKDRMNYCGFCGAAKHWTCGVPWCQFAENLPSFGFCGGCGTARYKN